MQSRAWQAMGVILLLALFPRDAHAYIDPGSGSLIFQTIVATLAGIAYAVRLYWSRIRGVFARRSADPVAPASTSAAEHRPPSDA